MAVSRGSLMTRNDTAQVNFKCNAQSVRDYKIYFYNVVVFSWNSRREFHISFDYIIFCKACR